MHKADILALVNYNNWATDRILSTAQAISPEQFTAPFTPNPGWGGLRGTLVHTLDTEYGWRCIVQFGKETPVMDESDFPDVASVAARWGEERVEWLAYVTSLSDEKLNSAYTYQFGDGPKRGRRVWHTLVHAINHSTHHRSEAALMLTGYGHSPGELDFNLFIHEHPEFVPTEDS
jgi:uncharacterized damage-inducible protein DinB